MKHWTGVDATALLLDPNQSAADVFAEAGTDERRIKRLYRILAFAVHPDRATLEGIAKTDAEAATVRLNVLYETQLSGGSAPSPKPAAAPHLIGKNSTYLFGDRIHESQGVATYETDRPGIRIEIAREASYNASAHALITVTRKLTDAGLGGYAPTVLDHGITSGRAWVAYQLPEGLYSLRQVRARYDQGLDGRDWAWMARRLYMVLDAAERGHGDLNLDTVFVHPEGHGIVLTGWTDGTKTDDMTSLFSDVLMHGADEQRQAQFADKTKALAPGKALTQYDLLLRHLYGERRYRPFAMTA